MKTRVISAVIGSLLLVGCGTPQGVVYDFYRAIEKGEVGEAMGYIDASTQALWGGKLKASIASSVERMEKCGGIDRIVTEETASKGDYRVVRAQVTFKKAGEIPGCQSMTDNVKLIKSDGSWRIVIG